MTFWPQKNELDGKMMTTQFAALAAALLFATAANAQLPPPSALPKDGDCPPAYVVQGNACEPQSNARFAVAKSGACPDAYEEAGNYCVATPAAKLAIRRAAMSCPSGYESTGNYCLSNK